MKACFPREKWSMEKYKTDIDKEKDDTGRTEVGRNEQSSHKGNVRRGGKATLVRVLFCHSFA